jgi:hypothetical protein
MCFVSVLCCFNKFVDHGGRRGDTAQALARWRHPVASSEALNVLLGDVPHVVLLLAASPWQSKLPVIWLPLCLSSPISLSPTTLAT